MVIVTSNINISFPKPSEPTKPGENWLQLARRAGLSPEAIEAIVDRVPLPAWSGSQIVRPDVHEVF